MYPTQRGAGPATTTSAGMDVPLLPTPLSNNAKQAWPSLFVDPRTRSLIAGHKPVTVAVRPLQLSGAPAAQPVRPTQPLPAAGFGAPTSPSVPIRRAGPGGSPAAAPAGTPPAPPLTFPPYRTSPPPPPTYQAAHGYPTTPPQVGQTRQVQVQTTSAHTSSGTPASNAERAAWLGWIALACALVGGVTLIPAVSLVLDIVIALAFWLCTCVLAISFAQRALSSASALTPNVRRKAQLGKILGWLATAIWVVVVVVHGL